MDFDTSSLRPYQPDAPAAAGGLDISSLRPLDQPAATATTATPTPAGDRVPSIGDVGSQVGYGLLSGIPNAVAGLMSAGQRGRELGVPIPGVDVISGMVAPLLPGYHELPGPKAGDTLKQAMGTIGLNPDNLPQPQSGPERIARMAGEGAVLSVAPELALGRAADAASIANLVRSGTTGFIAGAGGQAATEIAPEPLKPLAGLAGAAVSGVGADLALSGAAKSAAAAGRTLAPFTASGREGLAAERLANATSNPDAAIASLSTAAPQDVPGFAPTTFQQTGDMGLGSLERATAAQNPELFMQRRAEQNMAMANALSDIQSEGHPEAVADLIRSNLSGIDQDTQAAFDTAAQQARTAAQGLGPEQTAAAGGEQLRQALQARLDAAKAQEQSMWKAVDPNGTLNVVTAPLKQAAAELYGGLGPEKSLTLTPIEGQFAGIIGDYGPTLPFSRLTDLRSSISAAMREAKSPLNPNDVAYGRLAQLRGAVENAISDSVQGKVAQEQQAVASGALAPEDSMLARLAAEREGWIAGRSQQAATGFGGGQSAGSYAAGRSAPVSGAPGTEVPPSGGLPNATSPEGLPQDGGGGPLVDQGAADRLAAATAATKARKEAFGTKPVANILQRPGASYPYSMAPESVLSSVWKAGPAGSQAVGAVLRAANNSADAIEALKGSAAASARKAAMTPDGLLDPKKFAAWRAAHDEALKTLDKASPGAAAPYETAERASEHAANLAALRSDAIKGYEKSALGKFLGLNDSADVVKTIGGMFGAKDSVRKFRELALEVKGDPAAEQGLRRAVVEYAERQLISNTEAGTSGANLMKSDAFQNFVSKNHEALRQVFSDEEIGRWQAIARALKTANRSVSAVKLPGQSNTAQDLAAIAKHGHVLPSLISRVVGILGPGAGGYLLSGGVEGGITGMAAGIAASYVGGLLTSLRAAGIRGVDDLVTEAMLNPDLAKTLLMKAPKRMDTGSVLTLKRALRNLSIGLPAANVAASPERKKYADGGATDVQGERPGRSASLRYLSSHL